MQYLGQTSAAVTVPLAAAAPALFTANASGSGQALAINADGSLNGTAHPAAPGSTVTLYLNGVPSQFLAGPLAVTIGGQAASIVNSSLPSPAPGVTAIAVQAPFGTSAVNAAAVGLQVGAISSSENVTVVVGGN